MAATNSDVQTRRKSPNGPGDAKWLSLADRAWLADQLEKDAPGQSRHTKLTQTFLDPRIWQLGLLAACFSTCAYAYSLTAPIILQQATGFNARNVGLLIAANGIASAIGMVLNAMHSDRVTERHWRKSAAAGVAAVATVSILGGFAGPAWMGWLKDVTGGYQVGLTSMAVPSLIGALIIRSLRSRQR